MVYRRWRIIFRSRGVIVRHRRGVAFVRWVDRGRRRSWRDATAVGSAVFTHHVDVEVMLHAFGVVTLFKGAEWRLVTHQLARVGLA